MKYDKANSDGDVEEDLLSIDSGSDQGHDKHDDEEMKQAVADLPLPAKRIGKINFKLEPKMPTADGIQKIEFPEAIFAK